METSLTPSKDDTGDTVFFCPITNRHTHCIALYTCTITSLNVFQYALSNEGLTLGAQQIVLAVLRQQDNRPVLHLKFPIVLSTADLNIEAFWWLQVLSEIQPGCPNRPHVLSQGAVVAGEPLDLLFTQAQLEVWREDATGLPPVVSDARHTIVDVGQKTPLVALQTGMSQLDTCKKDKIRLVLNFRGSTHLRTIPFPRLW